MRERFVAEESADFYGKDGELEESVDLFGEEGDADVALERDESVFGATGPGSDRVLAGFEDALDRVFDADLETELRLGFGPGEAAAAADGGDHVDSFPGPVVLQTSGRTV